MLPDEDLDLSGTTFLGHDHGDVPLDTGQVLQLADKGRDQLEDENLPEKEKRLTSQIANERMAAAELLNYVQEHPELRQQRWTSVVNDGKMHFILNRPGGRVKKRMAVYCFVGRDFVRFLASE